MKNILITTDLSQEARCAYPVAISLAKAFGANLKLLFVSQEIPVLAAGYAIETPVWYVDPEIQKQVTETQRQDLEKEAKNFAGIDVETIFNQGNDLPHAEIIKTARELNAGSIVMASHGRTGFARIVMGSVTERVLRDAPCPVMVVPTKNMKK